MQGSRKVDTAVDADQGALLALAGKRCGTLRSYTQLQGAGQSGKTFAADRRANSAARRAMRYRCTEFADPVLLVLGL